MLTTQELIDFRYKIIVQLLLAGASYRQIGELMGVSRQRIQQLIRPTRKAYEEICKRSKDSCETCGVSLIRFSGHAHHRDLNIAAEDFNSPSNLIYLCNSCHMRTHHSHEPMKRYKPDPLKETCKHGHSLADAYRRPHAVQNGTGYTRVCKTCSRIRAAKWRAKYSYPIAYA